MKSVADTSAPNIITVTRELTITVQRVLDTNSL